MFRKLLKSVYDVRSRDIHNILPSMALKKRGASIDKWYN